MAEVLEYTLYLSSDDVRLAHHLARVLNQRGGRAITARGQEFGRGAAVTARINDWQEFPLIKVLETAQAAARPLNVQITGATLGPAPAAAILAVAQRALLLDRPPVITAALNVEADTPPGES